MSKHKIPKLNSRNWEELEEDDATAALNKEKVRRTHQDAYISEAAAKPKRARQIFARTRAE